MQRSPRLLQVFLGVVLLGLRTSLNIMALFVTVVTHDLREVILGAFKPCIIGSHIIFSTNSTRARVLLFMFFLPKPLFKLFLSLFENLHIAKRIICRLELLELFRLFDPGVFYSSALGLYLGCVNVSRTIISLGLVVYFLNIRSRLKACFGFNLNYLLDHLFSDI